MTLDEFTKRLDNMSGRTGATARAVALTAQYAVITAQKLAPRKTGYLASTILADVQDDLSFRLKATAPYAAIHEFGGTILGKPLLTFRGRSGAWVSVKKVKIPARPYMQPAMDKTPDYLRERLQELMTDML